MHIQGTDTSRDRRTMRALIVIAILACLTLLAAVIPSPYSIERPGPVVNTLGEITVDAESVPVIGIEGAETYEATGTLNLLTVSIFGTPEHPASWLSLLPGLVDPSQRIALRSEFYPEGITDEERTTYTTIQMDSSQTQATAAAFRELGVDVPVSLQVATVAEGGPADGALAPGDILLAADGTELGSFGELRATIAGAPDTAVSLTVERAGEIAEVTLTPETPEGSTDPMLGVTISSQYDFPADIDITVSEIGGPSAGMVFAISIINLLTPDALLGDLVVSGTGTMSEAGEVGGIGGLEQKMWAASRADTDLFLMPMANCGDVPAQIPGDMTVAPVATLDEALAAIAEVNAGETPAGIERCELASAAE